MEEEDGEFIVGNNNNDNSVNISSSNRLYNRNNNLNSF